MGIIGVHALVHAKKAEEIRAFFKDVLGWGSVEAGGGWPIFQAPLYLGLATSILLPGGATLGLYQPGHPLAIQS